jgi:hypothetical protein
MIEQYLSDFFDLVLVISEANSISTFDAVNIKEVTEITPAIVMDIDNNVVTKILEMYSNSTCFSMYDTVKKVEGFDKESVLEQLKDNGYFIFANTELKN